MNIGVWDFIARHARWAACISILAGAASVSSPAATIHWLTNSPLSAVEVAGVGRATLEKFERADGARADTGRGLPALAVYVEPPGGPVPGGPAMPAVAGTSRVVNGRLRFEPRFPWVHGVRYRAEYREPGDAPLVSHFELPPGKPARPTEVVNVFPSAATLPENQLKFYVQFSAPMSRGGTYEHVSIRDGQGRIIDLPFLELDEELWDPAMTRLTLLIDPGRIKRGVKPLEDIGPVFEAGNRYTLRIDAACRDAAGRPLAKTFAKDFQIGAADRTPPDPGRWTLNVPKSGTREPLIVRFDEPMDQALALRLIRVAARESNASIAGEVSLLAEECEWRFSPAAPWKPGPHRLVVATTIEDLAGNNIGKTFDVDLAAGARRRLAGASVAVSFEVK